MHGPTSPAYPRGTWPTFRSRSQTRSPSVFERPPTSRARSSAPSSRSVRSQVATSALIDVPAGPLLDRLTAAGVTGLRVPLVDPFRLDVPDASLDAVVSLWSGFRGVDPAALAEVDRALRPGGRLLVVHDYGRDDVCGLGEPDAPEYRSWSRREGPFLSGGGFQIRVVHCFWTFPSVEDAQEFLGRGVRGARRDRRSRPEAAAARLERRRLPSSAGRTRGRRVGRARWPPATLAVMSRSQYDTRSHVAPKDPSGRRRRAGHGSDRSG